MLVNELRTHLAQLVMMETIEIASEMLRGLEATYMSRISIEVSRVSQTIDNASKKLSLVAVFLLPISFLTGLFGMNVKVAFNLFNFCIFVFEIDFYLGSNAVQRTRIGS